MRHRAPASGTPAAGATVQELARAAAAVQGDSPGVCPTRGPIGVLVYHPTGRSPMSPAQLGIELLSNIAGALVAAALLAMGGVAGFGARVLFVTLLGLFASLAIDVSYWNWYGFPGDMTLAAMLIQVSSWFFGGLVLARMIRPPA